MSEGDPYPEVPADDAALLAKCRVETFRAGGPGGQHQNTTETGVRIIHEPTGVRAIARDERSQRRNRALALARLRAKLAALGARPKVRKSTKTPAREKRKRLESKRRRSQLKKLRRKPPRTD